MKRFFAVILLLVIVFMTNVSALTVFAETLTEASEETEANDVSKDLVEDILSFSCKYDKETKKVNIMGTMDHDAFTTHKDSSIEIYSIPPGSSEYDVVTKEGVAPLEKISMTVSFDFTFKANDVADIYSKYAIFLRSPDGKLTLGANAQLAEVESSYEYKNDRAYFKGVSSSVKDIASKVDAGTVIIPVYADRLITDQSNGHIYQIDKYQLFFDKTYVDELDSSINSASASGAKVYLQFLFENKGDFFVDETITAKYIMPDMYDENTLLLVHSMTDFVADRYDGFTACKISGIVVGKAWDNYGEYNFYPNADFETYTERCSFFATVVANSARCANAELDIVVPIASSNIDTVSNDNTFFEPKTFFDALLEKIEKSYQTGLDLSMLIETSEIPFGISNENLEQGIDVSYHNENSKLCAGKQQAFSDYLASLNNKYASAPGSYMFLWSPADSLRGNALSAAYAYSYYALLSDTKISAFITELNTSDAAYDLAYLMRSIDTANGFSSSKHFLTYFGKSSWEELEPIAQNSISSSKLQYYIAPKSLLEGQKGTFTYFDFSDSLFPERWYRGVGCNSINIDYTGTDTKALRANLTLNDISRSELIYDYEFHENMSYTPYLKFDFKIEDATQESLYEVEIICENVNVRFESSCFVRGNELCEIVLDLSQYSSFGIVEDIKICVKALNGATENCTLWLYGISGHSTIHTSEELKSLILEERDRIQNPTQEESAKLALEYVAIAIGAVVVAAAIGIGIVIMIRREHGSEE